VYPREDLREGRPLDAAEFAVHLDQVQTGGAPEVYQDPRQFFERTYLTRNLTTLAGEVLRRLAGERTETSAVFNLVTQFGGGKTHALTLLYHLARHGSEAGAWSGVARLLEKAGVASVPRARTAVFVGQKFDPRGGDDDTPLRRTPWGEIAWQLAGEEGYGLLAGFDQDGISPGGDTIAKLFRLVNQPILILMDELMNYISRYRKSGLGGQLYNFIQNLSEEARGHDRVVLAISIPASELEMSADDQLDYERVKKLLDRLGKAILMAAEAETAEIIRRRLFEWDARAVTQEGKIMLSGEALVACDEYARWVIEHRQQIPGWFPVDHARDAFAATYPFHPLVISVFERKWQSLARFQRTRGVLRLLALWVSHAYQEGFKGAYGDPIISLGTAPLDDPMFRAAVFEQLGEARLEGPVTTDICGRRESHATRLDLEAQEALKKARLHRKVATTIFFESNGGQYQGGATVPEIRFNIAEPELDIGHLDKVLEAIGETFYYLRVERNRYRFSLEPALNKLLADRLASIHAGAITARVRAEVEKVFGPGPIERMLFPQRSSDISDRPVLTLAVLAPEHHLQDDDTLSLVKVITQEHGSTGRTFKSALIWVIAESDAPLREDARKLLAWEEIAAEEDELRLDVSQQKKLDESIKKARLDLRETVWRSYKNLALLGKDNELRVSDLGLVHSSAASTMMNLILNRLRQEGEVEEAISPNFLVRNWSPAFKEWSTRAVRDAFFASPQFPRLLKAEAIKDTIARGVSNGILAYVGKRGDEYHPFLFESDLRAEDVEISDEMFIITGAEAAQYKPRLTKIVVSPEQAQIEQDGRCKFEALGLDQHGREIATGRVEWRATGGTIDATGLFHAGQQAGHFEVTATTAGLKSLAAIMIGEGVLEERKLTSIIISPAQVELKPGVEQPFIAWGLDQHNREMPLDEIEWQATGGRIDAAGLFHAGHRPGDFEISATAGGVSGSTPLTVIGQVGSSQKKLSWAGEVPAQKWMNFYMKVLTKFAANQEAQMTLRVNVTIEATGETRLSEQKIEEMRMMLRELGVSDEVVVE
jgi:hypothetical protein